MRKLLNITILLLFIGITFGQAPQRGNSFCLHVFTTLKLKPDVSLKQYEDFLINEYFPEFEKHFIGVKLFFIKGEWGMEEDEFGMIYYFENDEIKYKYYKKGGGGFTEEGIKTFEKVKPSFDELLELMEDYDREYTCWYIL
jgi:hypothetical protein